MIETKSTCELNVETKNVVLLKVIKTNQIIKLVFLYYLSFKLASFTLEDKISEYFRGGEKMVTSENCGTGE